MSQWITEEQTPHLRLSAEAEEVLYLVNLSSKN